MSTVPAAGHVCIELDGQRFSASYKLGSRLIEVTGDTFSSTAPFDGGNAAAVAARVLLDHLSPRSFASH